MIDSLPPTVPGISVIVATFNDEATIDQCVRRIMEVYPTGCEVLVVDGGTDRTGGIVTGLSVEFDGVRYIRNEDDQSRGHAIKTGIAAARGDIMVEMDANLQFLPEEIPRLVGPIRAGFADVVLGSRFTAGSRRLKGSTTWPRRIGSKAISAYASLLYWHRMTDVQAGLLAWNRLSLQSFEVRSDNGSHGVEIAVRALQHGLRVIDVPVTTDARQGRVPTIKMIRAGITLLADITRFRLGMK